jgi:hypothetical protein
MEVISRPDPTAHIAPCGLFCSNCGKFRAGRCQGCQIEPGFGRCPIRRCVVERSIQHCAACPDFAAPRDYRECGKVNNLIAQIIGFVLRSNRPGALALLRDQGPAAYLAEKRRSGRM